MQPHSTHGLLSEFVQLRGELKNERIGSWRRRGISPAVLSSWQRQWTGGGSILKYTSRLPVSGLEHY